MKNLIFIANLVNYLIVGRCTSTLGCGRNLLFVQIDTC